MKKYCGIDASLNSTGITVLDDKKITFYSVCRVDNLSKYDKGEHIQLMINKGDVIFLPVLKKGKVITIEEQTDKKGKTKKIKILDYSATEVNKVSNNLELVKKMSTIIKNDFICGIEGLSYGAKGSSLIDIAMNASLIRGSILQIVEEEKFSVFAPSEVKKFATGSGAANKFDMLESFLNEDVKLAKLVKDHKEIFHNKKGEILSPLTDLVDSYWIAKMLKEKY